MSTQLIPFSFESASVRVITHDDGSWSVVAKDVAEALGYTWHHNLLSHIPNEWKGSNPITTLGGEQNMLTIAEQGLYFFLGRSDKPKALPFQRWLFGEVVPSIRKTGSYVIDSVKHVGLREAMGIAKDAARLARAFGFDRNMIALSANNLARIVTGIDVLEYMGATHLLADPRGRTYTPSELGKMCDPPLSAIKFNLLLEGAGLQVKEFGSWLPTDAANGLFEWLDTGKRHTNGTPVKQIKWFAEVLDRATGKKHARTGLTSPEQ